MSRSGVFTISESAGGTESLDLDLGLDFGFVLDFALPLPDLLAASSFAFAIVNVLTKAHVDVYFTDLF